MFQSIFLYDNNTEWVYEYLFPPLESAFPNHNYKLTKNYRKRLRKRVRINYNNKYEYNNEYEKIRVIIDDFEKRMAYKFQHLEYKYYKNITNQINDYYNILSKNNLSRELVKESTIYVLIRIMFKNIENISLDSECVSLENISLDSECFSRLIQSKYILDLLEELIIKKECNVLITNNSGQSPFDLLNLFIESLSNKNNDIINEWIKQLLNHPVYLFLNNKYHFKLCKLVNKIFEEKTNRTIETLDQQIYKFLKI